MSSAYQSVCQQLQSSPKRWWLSGVAGFIGSHILDKLLELGQTVIGVDNFSTGKRSNLEAIRNRVGESAWSKFRFIELDIADYQETLASMRQCEIVLHQAALGSVPRSIEQPLQSHRANVDGFLNVLVAAKESKVGRVVFASSSSVYGDSEASPKEEHILGQPLSPYALTKLIDEQYARLFGKVYGLSTIGLRYFNVFGPRQDPEGPYAAVIPRWLAALKSGAECVIYGDGQTSRDFCYVENVVQANVLAGCSASAGINGQSFNIACGEQLSLNQLHQLLFQALQARNALPKNTPSIPRYEPFRSGDIRHSKADIKRALTLLEYAPQVKALEGITKLAQC